MRTVLKSETVFDKLNNCLMRCSFIKDNEVIEKTVPIDIYLKILGDNTFLRKEIEMIEVGKLPPHYYNARISSEGMEEFEIILFYPAEKRFLFYAGKQWHVPFPPLVFYFRVKKGTLQLKLCFALAANSINDDALLKCYPFGNVSSASGSICLGNISTGTITNFLDTEDIVFNFFNSETNGDYYSKNTATKYRQEELLKKLENMSAFPADWLKDSSGTVGSLFKGGHNYE